MTSRHLWPALTLATLLGLAHLFATPAFWPVDETAHVAYADHLVGHAALPSIDTPIPRDLDLPGLDQRLHWERQQRRNGRLDIWTSNHPPLPYLVQGGALRIGQAGAGAGGGLALARLTSTAWFVLGVWVSGLLAARLTPAGRLRREQVGLAVALVVAVTPTLTHLAGVVFNDAAGFALTTACLLLGVRAAVDGVGRNDLALAAALATAGGLTRVTVLPAVAAMACLLAFGWWRTPGAIRPELRRRDLLLLVPVAGMVAFWVHNTVVYGDPTASGFLLEKFQRDVNAPLGEVLGNRFVWLLLWDRMVADLTTGHWTGGLRGDLTEAVLVAGLLAGLVRWLPSGARALPVLADRVADRLVLRAGGGLPAPAARRPWSGRRPRRGTPAVLSHLRARPLVACWVVCTGLVGLLALSALEFHASGGSLHGRYAVGGWTVMATALVLLVWHVARVGRWLVGLVPVVLLSVNAGLLTALLREGSRTWDRTGIHIELPLLAGRATSTIVAVLLVASAGLLLAGLRDALRTSSDRPDVNPTRPPSLSPAGPAAPSRRRRDRAGAR